MKRYKALGSELFDIVPDCMMDMRLVEAKTQAGSAAFQFEVNPLNKLVARNIEFCKTLYRQRKGKTLDT